MSDSNDEADRRGILLSDSSDGLGDMPDGQDIVKRRQRVGRGANWKTDAEDKLIDLDKGLKRKMKRIINNERQLRMQDEANIGHVSNMIYIIYISDITCYIQYTGPCILHTRPMTGITHPSSPYSKVWKFLRGPIIEAGKDKVR